MSNKKMENVVQFWLPIFIWCAVIYYFSSVPDLKSGLPSQWDLIFRKIAHMTEYGVLTFLFFRAAVQNLNLKKSVAYSAVFSITYALTDEYHQLFVFGRHGSLNDVFIDSLGVFFVIFLIDKRLINVSLKSY